MRAFLAHTRSRGSPTPATIDFAELRRLGSPHASAPKVAARISSHRGRGAW